MVGTQTTQQTDTPPKEDPVVATLDDQELSEAMAQLSPEELAGAGLSDLVPPAKAGDDAHTSSAPAESQNADPGPQGQQDTPATQPATTDGEPGKTPGDPIMVPKARLDQEIQKSQQLSSELTALQKSTQEQGQTLSYLAGQVDALKATAQMNGGQHNQEPTPEQKLADVETRSQALQKRFDDGEINSSEYIAANNALVEERMVIRLAAQQAQFDAALNEQKQTLQQGQPQAQTQTPEQRDAFVEQETNRIEAEHPFLGVIPPEYTSAIVTAALQQLSAAGSDARFQQGPNGEIAAADGASLLALRQAMGQVSDRLGPGITGMTLEQVKANATKTQGPGTQPAQTQTPGGQAEARAQKLALQSEMPPNIAGTGSPAPKDGLTEGQIISMAAGNFAALESLPDQAFTAILES